MEKIYHIPHGSTLIPKKYLEEYSLSIEELKNEAEIMCDSRTLEMIVKNTESNDKLIFPYSRIFCDVERFNSDEEIMNSVGMGVLYTKTHDQKVLRVNPSKKIIEDYYKRHHEVLTGIIAEKLQRGDVLVIDLHSYSKEPLEYELNKTMNRPEICIGLNERFDEKLVEKLIYTLKDFNYTYAINEPFSGCLIPSDYIDDKRVHGIMIEIRKDVYDTPKKFKKIKRMLQCLNEF